MGGSVVLFFHTIFYICLCEIYFVMYLWKSDICKNYFHYQFTWNSSRPFPRKYMYVRRIYTRSNLFRRRCCSSQVQRKHASEVFRWIWILELFAWSHSQYHIIYPNIYRRQMPNDSNLRAVRHRFGPNKPLITSSSQLLALIWRSKIQAWGLSPIQCK